MKLLQMEVDKSANAYQEKEMEVKESRRLHEIEQTKLRMREDQLRESAA